ncbi:MAG: type II toxin-antitoxin system MqsA family antitoxin [Dehalococcoidia bacterium]
MRCVVCKRGEPRAGSTTVTIVRETLTLVVKNVPALICESCGDEYFDEEVLAALEVIAERSEESGVEVVIREYHAA